MGKRLFDILFSFFMLVSFAPFFLIVLLLVRLSSPGPLFYAHCRVGYLGKPFDCFKFRTMYQNADAKLQPLLASNPALRQEWETYFKLKADPRVTWIGKFLRKTSLDELPQVWNVFKGDMSIVGPRPLTEYEVTHYLKDKAKSILSVKPGLTTLWVIHGRNDLSIEERVVLEEQYVNTRTFWLDCKLIVLTAIKMIIPSGAY